MIEKLVGWRGDDVERQHFYESFTLSATSIIGAGGNDVGWMTVERHAGYIYLNEITIVAPWQSKGIGTMLLGELIEEARDRAVPLRLSTAKINPARRLYERLGFHIIGEHSFKIEMEIDSVRK